VSLSFTSNLEFQPHEYEVLAENAGSIGWLLFGQNEFTLEDLPKEQAEDKDKTPSKRLRSVLFILWKQKGSVGDFEVYYREQVEKIITKIKSMLDE
jgi:hypothetical protein